MDKKSYITTIKSNKIIKHIFGFSGFNFQLKLFKYSKFFQELLDIKIFDYKKVFFPKTKFQIKDYLSFKNNNKEFNKDLLEIKLKNYLTKYPKLSFEDVNKYINEYFKLYEEKIKLKEKKEQIINYANTCNIIIDIYSPFFESLSKNEYFRDIFTINLPIELISKKNLLNDYITIFNNFEKNKVNYHSINISLGNKTVIDMLDKFTINFNQLKKINFNILYEDSSEDDEDNNIDNTFINKIFSFFQKNNNLKYLHFSNPDDCFIVVDNNVFEKINIFQELEHLILKNFVIKNPFLLNLPKLRILNLDLCQNFSFAENSLLNLEKLDLNICKIIKTEYLTKLPKARSINLIDEGKSDYNLIFDFSSFQNVEKLYCNKHDFLSFTGLSLEFLILCIYKEENKEIDRLMLEKILSMKKLKTLMCSVNLNEDNELNKVQGENTSVEKITIFQEDIPGENDLNDFLKRFPNASHFTLCSINQNFLSDEIYLDIREDYKSNIKSFDLQLKENDLAIFNCSSYENLTNVEFELKGQVVNLNNSFPIFNEKCDVLFKSLINFKLYISNISMNDLKILCENLNKMPKVKYFSLECVVEDITEDYYKKVIEKVLNMDLKKIELIIKKAPYEEDICYSREELLEINNDLELNNFEKIKIHKMNDNPSLSQFMKHFLHGF